MDGDEGDEDEALEFHKDLLREMAKASTLDFTALNFSMEATMKDRLRLLQSDPEEPSIWLEKYPILRMPGVVS